MTYGIDAVGVFTLITFISDKEPTEENIKKIVKAFEATKDEKSLAAYYVNVEFQTANPILEDREENEE